MQVTIMLQAKLMHVSLCLVSMLLRNRVNNHAIIAEAHP